MEEEALGVLEGLAAGFEEAFVLAADDMINRDVAKVWVNNVVQCALLLIVYLVDEFPSIRIEHCRLNELLWPWVEAQFFVAEADGLRKTELTVIGRHRVELKLIFFAEQHDQPHLFKED